MFFGCVVKLKSDSVFSSMETMGLTAGMMTSEKDAVSCMASADVAGADVAGGVDLYVCVCVLKLWPPNASRSKIEGFRPCKAVNRPKTTKQASLHNLDESKPKVFKTSTTSAATGTNLVETGLLTCSKQDRMRSKPAELWQFWQESDQIWSKLA